APGLVPQHGAPERHDLRSIGRAWDDEQALDLRGVGGKTDGSGGGRDPAGKVSMASRHTAVALDERDHAHGHAVVPHVDVRLLLFDAWQLADRLYESGACRERPGRKIRGPTVAEHAPLRGALGREELLWADLVVHEWTSLSPNTCCEASVVPADDHPPLDIR